jgi:hypothetical protein
MTIIHAPPRRRKKTYLREDQALFLILPEQAQEMATDAKRREADAGGMIVRCPLCNGPMLPVMGRRGPYIRCLCPERNQR